MSFDEKLSQLVVRHQQLSDMLANPDKCGDQFAAISKEYSDLTPIVALIEELQTLKQPM